MDKIYKLIFTMDDGTEQEVQFTAPQGEKGTDGQNGEDGVGISKIEKTSSTGNVDTYTITFTDGSISTFTVTNGVDGADGADGYTPIKGKDYFDGAAGKDGTNGKDGTSVTVKSVSESTADGGSNVVTFSDGKTLTVKNGSKGSKGDKGDKGDQGEQGVQGIQGEKGDTGKKGEDGVGILSINQTTTSSDDGGSNVFIVTLTNGTTATFTVKNGSKGSTGATGATGADGKDGENYVLTDADKQEIANIVAIGDIPEYWQAHLNERVEAIRRAMESAGRNKSSFFFYSDAHWANENTYTSKLAPTLLKYLHKKTPINKTNFGGDIVFGEGSSNTDTMEYLWDWREQLRDLPNHHSVIGNHDDGHGTNDRILSKEYIYSYLLAPEENNDIVWGGDFYYYIDDKAENTRYLYLDVFYEGISSSQKEFVKEAIKTVPAAWHIVAIGHAWFANDYSVYPPVLNGFATEVQDLLGMFDRYNAREGEFAECGGWVELCIGGHYHLDHYEHTTGGIPVIIVEADTFHDRGGTMPTHGNTSESAVSAVVVDYYDKIVKVIRVGRGESYEVPINRVSPPNYTNVIPLSIDKDGTPFANGKGWMANSRIGSGGIYAGNQTAGTDSAQWVTGHIEINPNIDNVIRLKNVTFQQNTSNSNHGIAFFDSSFSRVTAYGSVSFIAPGNITGYGGYSPVLDSDTNILEFTLSAEQHLTNKDVKYIAICCGGISDNSIITINEPIE